jgi:hypothetical protein
MSVAMTFTEQKGFIFTTLTSLQGDPRSITINTTHSGFCSKGIFFRKEIKTRDIFHKICTLQKLLLIFTMEA